MWWDGAERVAIAREVRIAEDCRLCRARKHALSPGAVHGAHDTTASLPGAAVEAIHRIVTDTARLSRTWFEALRGQGLDDAHYVELVGVVVSVLSIDEFHRGLGLALEPLPVPETGNAERRRPSGAADEGAWVPTVPPAALDEPDADIYGGAPHAANVIRALSLVPTEVRVLADLHGAHYLSIAEMRNFNPDRALSRAQMELIAARVSALNECFY
jgi:alkylhydroperoxidase family enzyme